MSDAKEFASRIQRRVAEAIIGVTDEAWLDLDHDETAGLAIIGAARAFALAVGIYERAGNVPKNLAWSEATHLILQHAARILAALPHA